MTTLTLPKIGVLTYPPTELYIILTTFLALGLKATKDTKAIKVMMVLGIKDTKENLLNAINAMDAITQIDIFTGPSLTPNHIVTRIVEIIH